MAESPLLSALVVGGVIGTVWDPPRRLVAIATVAGFFLSFMIEKA